MDEADKDTVFIEKKLAETSESILTAIEEVKENYFDNPIYYSEKSNTFYNVEVELPIKFEEEETLK